jgi:hypothetical protein
MGYLRSLQGYARESCDSIDQSVTALKAMGNSLGFLGWTSEFGGTLLCAGRRNDAIALAEEIIALARRTTVKIFEASALLLVGAAAEAPGDGRDGARAAQSYRESLALADELSMRPLAAQCHAGLSRLWRTDKPAEAETHFALAAAMYRDVGMKYWLEKLGQESA